MTNNKKYDKQKVGTTNKVGMTNKGSILFLLFATL